MSDAAQMIKEVSDGWQQAFNNLLAANAKNEETIAKLMEIIHSYEAMISKL